MSRRVNSSYSAASRSILLTTRGGGSKSSLLALHVASARSIPHRRRGSFLLEMKNLRFIGSFSRHRPRYIMNLPASSMSTHSSSPSMMITAGLSKDLVPKGSTTSFWSWVPRLAPLPIKLEESPWMGNILVSSSLNRCQLGLWASCATRVGTTFLISLVSLEDDEQKNEATARSPRALTKERAMVDLPLPGDPINQQIRFSAGVMVSSRAGDNR